MMKTPIDNLEPGLELDINAAVAAGYIFVPTETAKMNPDELKDTAAEINQYVYCIHDGSVWRRHHAAGDFNEWSPSRYVKDAWSLVNYLLHHPSNSDDNRWWVVVYSNPFEEFVITFHHTGDGRDNHGKAIGEFCLAVTRAFCKSQGIMVSGYDPS
jgi:hypothetical protein